MTISKLWKGYQVIETATADLGSPEIPEVSGKEHMPPHLLFLLPRTQSPMLFSWLKMSYFGKI